ncbi:MAG TPA: protoporphyrinogen oxidase [Dermatophilaceae bacterium]|nr:protoporphyrinogen oxidase [Dermatophilaceae bacterium]
MPDASADPFATPRVAVVGAGLTGLLAARRLQQAGVRTVVLEAADRVGGNIRTRLLDGANGHAIDVGAEAMHLAAPQVGALIDELGLRESMVTARRGTSWLATPRGLRPLPQGVGPAGPTRLRPVLSSGILGPVGLARAALEPVLAGRAIGPVGGPRIGADEDIAVGRFVRSRFGAQVVDRIVDPLLGSLHAGDVDALGLRACAPSLVPAATSGGSLVVGSRRGPHPTPGKAGTSGAAAASPAQPVMSFVSWPAGMTTIVDRLRDDPVAPADVLVGTRVVSLSRAGDSALSRYVLALAGGDTLAVDGVVLAVPARIAAELVRSLGQTATADSHADTLNETKAGGVADKLAGIQAATVATVVLGFPRAAVADVPLLRDNGLLVASKVGSLLKAATFLSSKWPHLSGFDTFWIRMSAGRAASTAVAVRDDDLLVDHLRRDLRVFTGLDAAPRAVHVERWPATMPQLTVGHVERLTRMRDELAAWPGVALAGASYDGIGLASCITSADVAARLVSGSVGAAASR